MLKDQVNWQMISLHHCGEQECIVSLVRCSLSMYRSHRPYQPLAKGLVSRNKLVWPQHKLAPGRHILCTKWVLILWLLHLSLKFNWGLCCRKRGLPTSQTPIMDPIWILPIANTTYASHMVENQTSNHWTKALSSVQWISQVLAHFPFTCVFCQICFKLPRRPDTPLPVSVLAQFPKLYRELETVKAA